jgi:hypothetical protein
MFGPRAGCEREHKQPNNTGIVVAGGAEVLREALTMTWRYSHWSSAVSYLPFKPAGAE